MTKFNAHNLVRAVFLGVLLLGIINIANAQETLPKGGSSFGTAVKLEPGSYQEGGNFENDEVEYFYIENIKPGQEVNVKGAFIAKGREAIAILVLYDEDRLEVAEDDLAVGKTPGSIMTSWLPNADKDSYKYYIKAGSDLWGIASYSLDISLIDRYDAGSQIDAGDTFTKALSIASGEYKGYLSGKKGTDSKDFYKVAVKKGEALTFKLTPESEVSLGLKIYDSNRTFIKEKYAPNEGAIVRLSLAPEKNEDIFVLVYRESWDAGEELIDYTLDISAEVGAEVPVEEEILLEESDRWPVGEGLTEEEIEKAGKGLIKAGIIALVVSVIIGLVILAIIIVVIVVIVRKKKRAK